MGTSAACRHRERARTATQGKNGQIARDRTTQPARSESSIRWHLAAQPPICRLCASPPKRHAAAVPPPQTTPDPFDLQRFVSAQAANFDDALAELTAGRKRTHWMWYVFPQIAGLGSSAMAQRYAIQSVDEARAYVAHPLLGSRLQQVAEALLAVQQGTAREIMGQPDDLKLRSSMTLFAHVSPPGSVFHRVLARYFNGERDAATVERIE
jgi:uncharacterized protein (DUF1810 family)